MLIAVQHTWRGQVLRDEPHRRAVNAFRDRPLNTLMSVSISVGSNCPWYAVVDLFLLLNSHHRTQRSNSRRRVFPGWNQDRHGERRQDSACVGRENWRRAGAAPTPSGSGMARSLPSKREPTGLGMLVPKPLTGDVERADPSIFNAVLVPLRTGRPLSPTPIAEASGSSDA